MDTEDAARNAEALKAPTDPRKCGNCHRIYNVLSMECPRCGSEETQFVDADTHEPTDGFGVTRDTLINYSEREEKRS